MDTKKLGALERASYALSGYVADLTEVVGEPDLIIPPGFTTRDEYIIHLGNMIGVYRQEVGNAYNAIDEWQNI